MGTRISDDDRCVDTFVEHRRDYPEDVLIVITRNRRKTATIDVLPEFVVSHPSSR